jgi:hypothetical protein
VRGGVGGAVVTRRRSSRGFAILAVLLITIIASTLALVVVGAVSSLQVVEGADASGWRATAAQREALDAAVRALRWHPHATTGAARGGDTAASWQVSWTPVPPVTVGGWPRVAAQTAATAGRANRTDDLTLELRSEPWAMGVTCGADADVAAPLVVTGSGVYVGGTLRGRENVDFARGAGPMTPAGIPADGVRTEVFAEAAVHGGAGIFARGVEIHDGASVEYPEDTDRHAGEPVPDAWLAGPAVEFLLAAQAAAMTPGPALSGGRLWLDAVSPASGDELAGGRCLLLPPADQVVIEGTQPAEVGRLLVIVRGDAVLGRPGETVLLAGGIVVTGHLEVRGPVVIEGSLHAGSLGVEAPMSVTIPSAWREDGLPGAVSPRLAECGF